MYKSKGYFFRVAGEGVNSRSIGKPIHSLEYNVLIIKLFIYNVWTTHGS